MRAYPLIHNKWSNEHIMAGLFIVLLLYMFPQWLQKPADILVFAVVLALSLFLDEAFSFARHKRMICSVSAAVTAAIIHVLTPEIPLWGKLLGVFAAIIPGKQLWGGTGKNPLNPAILGYFIIRLIFTGADYTLAPTYLLIPALLLSLPFVLFRPYVSLGFFAGALLTVLTGEFVYNDIMITSSIFFGCIVLTDPVTVTPLKTAGLAGGFLCAFVPMLTSNPFIIMPAVIMSLNATSYLIDKYSSNPRKKKILAAGILKNPYSGNIDARNNIIDMTITKSEKSKSIYEKTKATASDSSDKKDEIISTEDTDLIIERIRENGVFGLGGAAFPTDKKLRTVMDSNVKNKYFIINAAECDPGLIHDKWLLLNRYDDISQGIELIVRCISFSKVIIAVNGKYDLPLPEGVSTFRVKDHYPAGYEKLLIRSILKKNVPVGFIPAKLGILVLNVQTVLSVYEAVRFNKKADMKYITISDLRTGNAAVAKVNTGYPVMEAIQKVYPDKGSVFTGGGIMQARMAEDTDIIGRDTNLIAAAEMPRYKESPLCSKCGACVSVCPQGLLVNRIADMADRGDYKQAEKFSPELCISCGLCSYMCLAGRNLSARVSEVKNEINALHKML